MILDVTKAIRKNESKRVIRTGEEEVNYLNLQMIPGSGVNKVWRMDQIWHAQA